MLLNLKQTPHKPFPLSLMVFLAATLWSSCGSAGAREAFALKNQHIQATFSGGRLTSISRIDGSDKLVLDNDEFEILLFDKSRFTVADYDLSCSKHTGTTATMTHTRKPGTSKKAPQAVEVKYECAQGPYLFKDVSLRMREGEKVDRLQVHRFSTSQKASRGGHSQPVFIGNWFLGMNYPCFYSRHSDGFKEPNFHYVWHYSIDLEGGDKEYAPRSGLVSLFHFPGYAKKLTGDRWGIQSKRAVMGIAADKEDNAELAVLDYVEAYRKPTRSYTHFNNWYTPEAKHLTVKTFVNDVADKIKVNLAKYGAKLDAMVPDDGWQRKRGFKKIYETDPRHEPMPEISKALRRKGIGFGIWIAIDGTTTPVSEGVKAGYKLAYPNGKSPYRYWGPQKYFNLLDPKYQADYKDTIGALMTEADVRYIKHDFNHMYTGGYLSMRHAREACLDVTLNLIDFERKLSPGVLINYTNGSFFSPFYPLFFEYLWMNSGDHGNRANWPQLSKLEIATAYRDNHFYQSFNNPERCVRPILPIANFMTHGVLHSKRVKYYNPAKDPIHDWVNYIVMYYARGTLLKELYISPDLMTEDQWKGLGTATAWAQANQDRMKNTVLIGGDCDKGKVYGYVSWNGNQGILNARNPDRKAQTLTVPFDRTVYYRGAFDKAFHARVVYPFVEEMPWRLTAGRTFTVEVPGDSVMVIELDAGAPTVTKAAVPEPLPKPNATVSGDTFLLNLTVPNEDFKRFDLLITNFHSESHTVKTARGPKRQQIYPTPTLTIQGKSIPLARNLASGNWALSSFDLRPYRGRSITVKGQCAINSTSRFKKTRMNAWLVVDRKVNTPKPALKKGDILPWPVSQSYRRLTQELIPTQTIGLTAP